MRLLSFFLFKRVELRTTMDDDVFEIKNFNKIVESSFI